MKSKFKIGDEVLIINSGYRSTPKLTNEDIINFFPDLIGTVSHINEDIGYVYLYCKCKNDCKWEHNTFAIAKL